jgi:hypothetical protein
MQPDIGQDKPCIADRLPDCFYPVFLVAAWVVAVALVNPIGHFALNDDFAYGYAVLHLLETGDLRLSDWTAANLIAQVLWGALFCLPFGFSFTALRISTLVLGLLGVLSTYGALREIRVPAGIAVLGSLSLGFSPIYFALSFTFMTDVPFVSVAITSSWLLIRGLRRDARVETAGGLFLAGIAILIRQIGLAIPIAFAAAYIAKHGLRVKSSIRALFVVAGGITIQIAYEGWLRWSDRLPTNFGKQITTLVTQLHEPPSMIVLDAVFIITCGFIYLGFFLFPFLLVTALRSRVLALAVLAMAPATTALFIVLGKLMPLHHNVLVETGIGPNGNPSGAPLWFWLLVTFVSVTGAIMLFGSILQRLFDTLKRPLDVSYVFAIAATVVTFAPLPFLGRGTFGFYDRYLLVFPPWLMLALTACCHFTETSTLNRTPSTGNRIAITAATVIITGISSFTIVSTHDYLEANRVRWTYINKLTNDKRISQKTTDETYFFRHLWLGAEYVASFHALKGYTILATHKVDWWLPWEYKEIIVQKRNSVPH